MASDTKKFKTRRLSGLKLTGESLKAARVKQKISLEDAENETKIRAKYLEALEMDNYSVFSSHIYAMGFLRRYADFLGLDADKLINQQTNLMANSIKKDGKLSPARVKQGNSFVVTPRLLIGLVIFAAVVAILGYIGIQIKQFSDPPHLTIQFPQDNYRSEIDTIDIKGSTDSGAVILINNEQITPMPNGTFNKPIKLNEGLNTIQIIAKNRVDKISAQEIRVFYKPPEIEIKPQPEPPIELSPSIP